ncbi:MAG: gamma-glutamyltransferase [Candidatus Zixiibacteriota bacterium]|nr:MAG: gamma-glutamyltransferase [candidate division Zixibacteria bacterium]
MDLLKPVSSRFIRHVLLLTCVLTVVIGLSIGCDGVKISHFHENGVVASVSPIASQVGEQIFRQGGNAFDAAVGVGFALAVVHPQAGNLGGGGFALARDGGNGHIIALDFREKAPLASTEDMYLDNGGGVVEDLSSLGALSAGVPGTVAGLHALWKEYGTLPWEDLVTIAAKMADTGFIVDEYLAGSLADYQDQLSVFPETESLLLPGGKVPGVGEQLILSDLAATLYLIAAEGSEAFYNGFIADSIVACMAEHGGLITAEDLQQYQVMWRQPVHFEFDSLDIYSMCPPSSGGIVMGQILKLLEPYDLSRYFPDSPEYMHLFCEASRLAYADRSIHLGDPAYYSIPGRLLSPEYIDERRKLIPVDHAGSSDAIEAGSPLKYESDETTHFSVCDKHGNMVSVTTTLNATYGSKLVVSGAGFLLNNEMDDFSIRPGHPNLYGLIGGEANKIEPGKRMLSSMSPTLVLKDDKPLLVLGSPGGSRIITTVAQAIVGFSRFGLSLEEIVSQPRFHHQWLPDVVYLEEEGFFVDKIQALIKYGYHVQERSKYGDLQLIHITAEGLMHGASDPRRGGAVAGY